MWPQKGAPDHDTRVPPRRAPPRRARAQNKGDKIEPNRATTIIGYTASDYHGRVVFSHASFKILSGYSLQEAVIQAVDEAFILQLSFAHIVGPNRHTDSAGFASIRPSSYLDLHSFAGNGLV